ncbi:protein argonaute-2 [Hyalella azteca]|uniref:Protein argonaute-2 n=1 Tax=Hyalella azteca TaxID=294128 RepID=A0A8B7PFY0_HYAAZ|nr:protein argonaute-2 [Hyalella azteca]
MTWKQNPLPDKPEIPVRLPREAGGVGTLGRPVNLKSNYFQVEFESRETKLFHYDIKINDAVKDEDEKVATAAPLPVGLSKPAAAEESGGKGKRRKKGRGKGQKDSEATETTKEEAIAGVAAVGGSPDREKMTERRIPKAKRCRIFANFIEKNPGIFSNYRMAYDGEANAYCSKNPSQFVLNQPVKFFFVFDDEIDNRKKKYLIEWKLVQSAKISELLEHLPRLKALPPRSATIFQMLEVMFNYERSLKFATVGRNQFYSQDNPQFGENYRISDDKEGVIGFYCSLRARCGWKDTGCLMLNLDVSHTAFYTVQPLLTFLQNTSIIDDDIPRTLDRRAIDAIEKEIVKKDVRIVTIHGNYERRYKVTGVSKKNCLTHTFTVEKEGVSRQVNIVQYFQERYDFMIQYPELNCIKVGTKETLLPIEVCKIAPNQRIKGKLKDDETKNFIKQTAVKPQLRFQQVNNIVTANNFPQDRMLESLGVRIKANPVDFKGRVLDPPVVELMNGFKPRVERGQWRADRDRFLQPAALDHWAVLNFSRAKNLDDFIYELMMSARQRGMDVYEPYHVSQPLRPEEAERRLIEAHSKNKDVRIIVCVIEKEGNQYKIIKETGDRVLRVITQCVLSKNACRPNPATIGNILLKMNAKLGGVNHKSFYTAPPYRQLFAEPILVMGADVNHPPSQDRSTPSLVAVVGSLDPNACRYAVEVRHQAHRVEMIEEMKLITMNLLKQFYAQTKRKPTRIVMYRDGVSETQFNAVVAYELRAMRQACLELQPDGEYKPTMTFICVQKRHHTRLYAADSRDTDRSGNVLAGTVVDHTITSLSNRDFFLCSHAGIQGTSKPSHYTVLWDDCDMHMNQLQLLTYSLCHNYARCFRSVSIPTPVYYAHLAAARAKVHLAGAQCKDPGRWGLLALNSSTGSFNEDDLIEATRVERGTPGLSNQMFYQ